MSTPLCRIWFTYQGRPRMYRPWCECGWHAPGWGWHTTPRDAQRVADRHLMSMIAADQAADAFIRARVLSAVN